MQPLNLAERNSTFLSFLLLFLITIALIVTVIFFSIQVPFKENEQLRRKLFILQSEKEESDSFNVAMKEALEELNKFDMKKEPAIATEQRVQFKIDKMNKLMKYLPGGDNSIYASAVQNLTALNDAKVKIRKLEDEKNDEPSQ